MQAWTDENERDGAEEKLREGAFFLENGWNKLSVGYFQFLRVYTF